MKLIANQAELEILAAEVQNGTIVVKFFADWCGPCKVMNPVYENLSIDEKVKKVDTFVEINRDDNMDMIESHKFDFMSIPRFFVVNIKDGKIAEKKDMGGSQTKDSLVEQINEFVK